MYVRRVSVVIEQRTSVGAKPAEAFAFLHDPERRQDWDAMVDGCRLEVIGRENRDRLHRRRLYQRAYNLP